MLVIGAVLSLNYGKAPKGVEILFTVTAFFISFCMWWGIIFPRFWKITIDEQYLKISDSYGKKKLDLKIAEIDYLEVSRFCFGEREDEIKKIHLVLINRNKIRISPVFFCKYEEILNYLKSTNNLSIQELNK